LFAALFKGSDLLLTARFDEVKAADNEEIEAYCRSAVAMFIAAHGGNEQRADSSVKKRSKQGDRHDKEKR
jgi:hypothetical protein